VHVHQCSARFEGNCLALPPPQPNGVCSVWRQQQPAQRLLLNVLQSAASPEHHCAAAAAAAAADTDVLAGMFSSQQTTVTAEADYLGLEHEDKGGRRPASSTSRYTYERAIKIAS
jgi:hypothetical protein